MERTHSLFEGFDYDPIENPDWGFARNVRATLLTPSAEWVQSVCSFQFEVNGKTLIAPNRDYPYEGLLAYHAGENWKFIDCVGLSMQSQNGVQLPLTASKVRLSPWQVEYQYRVQPFDSTVAGHADNPILVTYYLDSQNSSELLTGSIEFHFPEGLAHNNERLVALIQPFLDIRHMYGGSIFEDYRIRSEFEDHRRIHVSCGNRVLTFYSPEGQLSVFAEPEIVNWHYKLGTGSRTETLSSDRHESATVFIGERKNVAAFFNLQLPVGSHQDYLKLYVSARLSTSETIFSLPEIQKNSDESKRKDLGELKEITAAFPLSASIDFRDEIWARIVALTKFKTYVYFAEVQKYICVPPAGAWWFKTAWYRDVFEGLLNSFETLMKIPRERQDIREITLSALSLQDKRSGLILNKIPEFSTLQAAYNSCDATLLCFLVANEYFKRTRDEDFALAVLACVKTTVSRFKVNGKQEAAFFGSDGPPRLDESTGLLLCAPHHSWIDTRSRRIQYDGRTLQDLPNRLSVRFLERLCEKAMGKGNIEVIASSPCFFLPEINAQWITVLAGAIETIDLIGQDRPGASLHYLRDEAETLLARAKRAFKSMFWNENNGYLFNAVFEDKDTKDDLECEAGVTATALLGETVFTSDEVQAIWNCIKKKLLADRRLTRYGNEVLPFGILTKYEDQKVFYGDDQYHGPMIWPRSTPYVIKLLRLLNRDDTAREILINNLDHQMTECAIFYNQELFSPALGNNAHPNGTTSQNPVPVKNPIQFWSQWCDAYLEVFGGKE